MKQTTLKHSFPTFQACVKMKPLLSIIFPMFQACIKMKPILSPFRFLFSRLVKLMKSRDYFAIFHYGKTHENVELFPSFLARKLN